MTDALAHRGPDGEAFWMNSKQTAGFGHRRLAIIDLSSAAAQPMHYAGRYTIVYNGEIYNYIEIKASLLQKGYAFHSQSDTEVILAAYDCYKQDCLQLFDGMFAFAIWDEQQQELFAARDRLGEKPFYYFIDDGQLVFASEMKALWAAGVDRQVNEEMLYNYLTLGYTLNPAHPQQTFYTGIHKLPAGTYLLYRPHQLTIYQYRQIHTAPIARSDQEAVEQFNSLFQTAIKRRLRSDVPLGTSLSGGLDSSTVLAHIQQPSCKTFSAVFPGFKNDESGAIRTVAAYMGVPNIQVQPDAESLVAGFDKLCYHQEEPFQSASIAAQFYVYQTARMHGVPVLLDGQGADEILAGYRKYYHWYWQQLYTSDKKALYKELQAARKMGITEPWGWQNKLAATFPGLAAWYAKQRAGHRHIARDFQQHHGKSFYRLPLTNDLNSVLYYNTFENGLEDLLRYADRNAMAHGVEVRLPFLYYELVTFIFSLPAHFKIRKGYTKWLLRETMKNRLPHSIVWQTRKIGFEPPQQQWMQHPQLQEYVREAKQILVQKGILKKEILQKKIQPMDAHAAENYDWRYLVAGWLLR
jgi:asparagine synthase (glutamine-hydrolyzing)